MITFTPGRLAFLLTLLFFAVSLAGQSDIDDAFDDGVVADPLGAAKLDLLSFTTGEALVGFEYYLGDYTSASLFAGPRIGDYQPNFLSSGLLELGEENDWPWESDGGFSYVVEVRYYYGSNHRRTFNSLAYHGQRFSAFGRDGLGVSTFSFSIGYRLGISSRFFIEGELASAYALPNDAFTEEYQRRTRDDFEPLGITGIAHLRAGYEF